MHRRASGSAVVMVSVLLLAYLPKVELKISLDLPSSQVLVDDNGTYQNLVVFINLRLEDKVKQEQYLAAAKAQLTSLSESIYSTIGLRFGTVTILVPSHWDIDESTSVASEAPESADIIIRPNTNRNTYSQHIQGCGKPALHMVIDSKYIGQESNAKTKVLLHEWMHARYGVFDEHPIQKVAHPLAQENEATGEDFTAIDQQKFYHSSNSGYEVVRCGLKLEADTDCEITDVDWNTFLPKNNCPVTVKAPSEPAPSLMSNYELENISLLCDSSTHNAAAPNRHNRLCDDRSVLEVIELHKDFLKLSEIRKRALETPYKPPDFVINSLDKRGTIVFVVDSSNSMRGTRLFLAQQAIAIMIRNFIEDNTKIMIVEFDHHPAKVYPTYDDFALLDSVERRMEAISHLRRIDTGPHTCIGCGLQSAYNDTKRLSGGTVTGTYFILLTDGADTKRKDLARKMFEQCRKEKFFIDTILLSDEADKQLVDLARGCASRVYTATEDPLALIDGFAELIPSRVIRIYGQKVTIGPGEMISGEFRIERHLSSLAKITFSWYLSAQPHLSFTLVRESNGEIVKRKASDETLGYLTLPCTNITSPQSKSKTAKFTYYIANDHPSVPLHTTVTVNTRTLKPEKSSRTRRSPADVDEFDVVYSMKAFVKSQTDVVFTQGGVVPEISIHAYLPQGSTPHLPNSVVANITIASLIVDDTSGREVIIKLRDTGVGADTIARDGIYSAYFADFDTYNATYYVRVRAAGAGFMRYASAGYFAVYMEPSIDIDSVLPPSAINDLMVMAIDKDRINVTFVSPGANLDRGQATQYRAWFSTEHIKLRNGTRPSAHAYSMTLPNRPKKPYQKERLSVKVPEVFAVTNQTLWIALTAVDEHRVESKISNLVSARYIKGVRMDLKPEDCTQGTIVAGLCDVHFFIIIGALMAVLFLIIVIVAILVDRRRKMVK